MAAGKEYIAAVVFMAPRRKAETKIVLPSQRFQETNGTDAALSKTSFPLHIYYF